MTRANGPTGRAEAPGSTLRVKSRQPSKPLLAPPLLSELLKRASAGPFVSITSI